MAGNSLLDYPYNDSGNFLPSDFYPLTTPGEPQCNGTYSTSVTLQSNLTGYGTCINVASDNIVIDCDGYTVTGNGSGAFVNASDYSQIQIIGCNIENFEYLVQVNHTLTVGTSNVSNISVYSFNSTNVTVTTSRFNQTGLFTVNGTSSITTSTFIGGSYGYVYGNASVYDNTFEDNYVALQYANATNMTIRDNHFEHNRYSWCTISERF